MSRKTYLTMAAAALLFASALAVFCVFGNVSADTADDGGFGPADQPFGCPGPMGPAPDMGMRMPAEPGPERGVPGGQPPMYVIDAPERPDAAPERIIDDYGRMYEEKRNLETEGAEVYIRDPGFERDAGEELAKAINEVFDGAVVTDAPYGAIRISPEQIPTDHDVTFFELLMDHTDEGSWIRELLSVMIAQYASSQSESEGIAPSSGRDGDVPSVSPELVREGDSEKEPESYVDDVPEHTPSSESYLTQHGFDGGTAF